MTSKITFIEKNVCVSYMAKMKVSGHGNTFQGLGTCKGHH